MMEKNKKLGGRPRKRPAPEDLLPRYETETSSELAKEFGVSAGTIRSWVSIMKREMREQPEHKNDEKPC